MQLGIHLYLSVRAESRQSTENWVSSCFYLTAFYNNIPPYVFRQILEDGLGDNGVQYSVDSKLNGGQGLWIYSTQREQRRNHSRRLKEEEDSFVYHYCKCHHWLSNCVCGVFCTYVDTLASSCRANPSSVITVQPAYNHFFQQTCFHLCLTIVVIEFGFN